MVNINMYSNEEMVRVQFCDNIFFWLFSVVDRVAEVVRGHGGPPQKSLDSDEFF